MPWSSELNELNYFSFPDESAYFISTYFADPVDVCRRKTNLELVCSDGLGGNDDEVAYVIAKNKQSQIYLDEKEAKVRENTHTHSHSYYPTL